MKKILMVSAGAALLVFSYSVQAQEEGEAPPDPVPGATKPVREQNLDANDWIAVHEQGVADVKVTEGQIDANITGGSVDANITGGSVEAEITGGEVEVTNDVTVKLAEGEVLSVDVVADSSTFPDRRTFNLFFEDGDRWYQNMPVPSEGLFLKSMTCAATATTGDATTSLSVLLKEYYFARVPDLEDFSTGHAADVCGPFFGGHTNFAQPPTFTSYCKSILNWRTDPSTNYLGVGIVANPLVLIDKVLCIVHYEEVVN